MRFLVAALCAVSLYAADMTGRWVGPASTADNGQEFVLAIKQAPDGTITGYIQAPRATETIAAGKVDGANLTLDAERPGRNNAVQKVAYTGVLEGEKLKLTLPAFRRPWSRWSRRSRSRRSPGRSPSTGRHAAAPQPPAPGGRTHARLHRSAKAAAGTPCSRFSPHAGPGSFQRPGQDAADGLEQLE